MNAKIDENGLLHIKRKGRFVKAWCHKHDCYCGDRCHFFNESKHNEEPNFSVNILCDDVIWSYEVVQDLRGEE